MVTSSAAGGDAGSRGVDNGEHETWQCPQRHCKGVRGTRVALSQGDRSTGDK